MLTHSSDLDLFGCSPLCFGNTCLIAYDTKISGMSLRGREPGDRLDEHDEREVCLKQHGQDADGQICRSKAQHRGYRPVLRFEHNQLYDSETNISVEVLMKLFSNCVATQILLHRENRVVWPSMKWNLSQQLTSLNSLVLLEILYTNVYYVCLEI